MNRSYYFKACFLPILGSPEDLLLLTEDGPVLGKLNDVENPGEHGEIVRGERSRLPGRLAWGLLFL